MTNPALAWAVTSDLPLVRTMKKRHVDHRDDDAGHGAQDVPPPDRVWIDEDHGQEHGDGDRFGDDPGDQTLADLASGGMGEVELHRWVIGPGRHSFTRPPALPADGYRPVATNPWSEATWSGPPTARASRRPGPRTVPALTSGRSGRSTVPGGRLEGSPGSMPVKKRPTTVSRATSHRALRSPIRRARRSRPRWRPGRPGTGRWWPSSVRRSESEMKGMPLSICTVACGRDCRREWPGCWSPRR